MATRRNALLAAAMLSLAITLSGCLGRSPVTDESDLPIRLTRTESGAVDLDALYATVLPIIQRKLPGAYFRDSVFFLSCDKAALLVGRLVLGFERVQFGFPRRQVERISASVRTEQQLMDIWYQDDTNRYPAVKKVEFSGDLAAKQMIEIVEREMQRLEVTVCSMVISQLGNAVWNVNCTDAAGVKRVCYFNVENGEVREGNVR